MCIIPTDKRFLTGWGRILAKGTAIGRFYDGSKALEDVEAFLEAALGNLDACGNAAEFARVRRETLKEIDRYKRDLRLSFRIYDRQLQNK
jgi:hypothetical protein